jgi:translation initiation factor 3 subunit E
VIVFGHNTVNYFAKTSTAMADDQPTTADNITNGAASKAHKTPEEIAKEYDLLPRLIPHLDRHLIFPLLEFLSGQEDEASSDVIKAKYELLKPTNMSDYVANLWMEMNDSDSPPEEFAKKREEVLQRLALYAEETSKLTKLLEDDEVTGSLRSDKLANLKFLEEKHGVSVLDFCKAFHSYQVRSPRTKSISCMTMESFNIAVVVIRMLQGSYTNFESW